MIQPIRSDRDWAFDMTARQLWNDITATDRYADWWPWLQQFDRGDGFVSGATWRCEVSPPLPYVVRFTVHLEEVTPLKAVTARVTGDVEGSARLVIDPTSRRTCHARLISDLAPKDRWLRVAGLFARPVVRWGHDWVLDRGREQFIEHNDS